MILLIPEHPTTHPARAAEIAWCLDRNLANPLIARVLRYGAPDGGLRSPKLAFWVEARRPTFGALFRVAGHFPGEVVIIANADIDFDGSLGLAVGILPGDFYALSRWNPEIGTIDGTQISGDGTASLAPHIGGDAWIFRAPLPALAADFTQGTPYCDHRLARAAQDAGLRVSNPCRSIRAWHRHASAVRTYTAADTVPGPYAWLPPVAL